MRMKSLVRWLMIAFIPQAFAAGGFISGTVVNVNGRPEAGVWVIAETADLPTDYRKIVVTNDDGRFVLPEMPKARYQVWVRGYGLADSARVAASPGGKVTIKVRNARDAQEAATIYPASYWLTLLEPPTDERLRASARSYASQHEWMAQFKLNCIVCHQIGSARTRFPVGDLYRHGINKAAIMPAIAEDLDRSVLFGALDGFAARLAAGEVPEVVPARPQGVERNFVITQWGWGDGYSYAHDEIATDKRNPFLYANDPVYGVDLGNDHVLVVDPVRNAADRVKIPTWGYDKPWCENTWKPLGANDTVPYGTCSLGGPVPGTETVNLGKYQNPANPHNPMLDDQGRVWMTMTTRREWAEDLPEFCKKDPVLVNKPYHRQLGYFDTKTREIVPIDTCFSTHHLQFDKNGRLWTSGDTHVIGWLDTKKYDPKNPKTLEAALGWSEVRIDSNGDGRADTPVNGFLYGIIPNDADGSVWTAVPPGMLLSTPGRPGTLLRYDPATNTHEAYVPPAPGMGPRGIDVDSKGIVWTALAGSGHVARFDRSRCKQTWGAGDQCPEGWTLWRTPGPRFKGKTTADNGTDMHYYIWVDRFDTLGMGKDTVIFNGTESDSLIAFDPRTEQFTVIRIPYPLNVYSRGMDGRIDDPKAGWKGRAVWFTNGSDPIQHSEIPKSFAGKLQLRPDPLAR